MKEIWKDIEGYEGLYQVSNLGDVYSLRAGRRMVPSLASGGYPTVVLWVNKQKKRFYVHRLVASAFIQNPDNLPEVNHKDEDKQNNVVDNLEWCTRAYNNKYGTSQARRAAALSRPVEQLKDGVVVKRWESSRAAARSGYYQAMINRCCNGKSYVHKGFEWRFAT